MATGTPFPSGAEDVAVKKCYFLCCFSIMLFFILHFLSIQCCEVEEQKINIVLEFVLIERVITSCY